MALSEKVMGMISPKREIKGPPGIVFRRNGAAKMKMSTANTVYMMASRNSGGFSRFSTILITLQEFLGFHVTFGKILRKSDFPRQIFYSFDSFECRGYIQPFSHQDAITALRGSAGAGRYCCAGRDF
ncbi:MAG: hypothetical protein KDA84_14560 [Planctomycetaceae bacterium]|nr:hypothetical protein [Planctomycetaceae bacterium]